MAPAIRRAALFSVLTGGLALLAGCASEPESHVVSAPPPAAPQTQVVVTQPQVAASVPVQTTSGTIVVTQAPPTLQQELVTAQPTSDHKWVPGYWTWRNSRYEWMAGHWELPPSRGSVWIAPRWERTDSGAYRFYEGYWN
ncbi:MAG TPA: YXWGXW repeat-containing protein [Lacunisphaera sp.]|nr:YXWGXW repeat-containing protein [Lacunisphaera sp.]